MDDAGPSSLDSLDSVSWAILRGRDHLGLGEIDGVAEGTVALAISLGGARKSYSHADPNEDAACFAIGDGGTLAAVADAHNGREASEIALETLLTGSAAAWTARESDVTPERWNALVYSALIEIHYSVHRRTAVTEHSRSRSTVSLVLVRPREGRAHYACLGDSHIFRVGEHGSIDVGALGGRCSPRYFLGGGSLCEESLPEKVTTGSLELRESRALVLATDGLSERNIGVDAPEQVVTEQVAEAAGVAAPLRALAAARGIVECGLSAQRQNKAGDNLAAAVVWVGRDV